MLLEVDEHGIFLGNYKVEAPIANHLSDFAEDHE